MDTQEYLTQITASLQKTIDSNSLLIVIFTADWNKDCKALMKSLTGVSFGETTEVLVIRIDDCEDAEEVFNINSVPVVRIYASGQLVATLESCRATLRDIQDVVASRLISHSSQAVDSSTLTPEQVLKLVSSSYSATATGAASCCVSVDGLLNGYTLEDLMVAGSSNLGVGCGNPLSFANVASGEVVLDLGSGAGIDCFLASQKVGPSGIVIGVDMTPDMIHLARQRARENAASNISFRLGEIEYLPVADNSVDVVISNCVINLSPRKDQVYREMFRVLKRGGRIAISDVVLRDAAANPLPERLKTEKALAC